MLSRTKLSFPTLSLSLLTTLLLGCAPEDGADTAADQPTGTVNILFTDAPTDDFSAINVTLSRIELIPFNDEDSDADSDAEGGDGDDSDSDRPSRRATLFTGEATFDLLQLENFTSLFSVTPDVPAGEYRKIRLTVSGLRWPPRGP